MRTVLLLLLALLALPGAALAQGVMPETEAKDLEGTERVLPRDLWGEVNLLIIAFEREQGEAIDSWRAVAKKQRETHPKLDYYGIPVLPSALFLLGRPIRSGMRDQYTAEIERVRILLMFTNPGELRESLQVGEGTAVRAVLVDKAGKVLWWTSGKATDASGAAFSAAVAKALP